MARARNTRKISRPCSDRLRDQQSPFPADSTCECDLSRTITAPAWSAWISAKFIQPLADPDAGSRPTRVSETVVSETLGGLDRLVVIDVTGWRPSGVLWSAYSERATCR